MDACNTTKVADDQLSQNTVHHFLIDLKTDLNGKYISQNYGSYNLSKISPSNRTLNQYTCQMTGNNSQKQEFLKLLESDKNVIQVMLQRQNTEGRQNTTNTKKSRTTPKIKN